nr:hypothetical protein [Tanacetum cinerariifolium]
MTEFSQWDSGLAVPVFTQGDDPIACRSKAMDFLIAVASSRFPSTNNQLRTSINLRNHTEDLDAYDSNCNDVPNAKAVLLANLSNYGSYVISEEHIKSTREYDKEEKVKQDMDEIIEMEHSVAKLLYENKRLHKEIDHLKQIYKDQFDSIKRTHVRTKEHSESLILQLNSKSIENADLKAQIQEKFL